jgi:hypothetical protein
MAVSGEILAGLLGFSFVDKAGDTLDKIFESVFGSESFKDLLRDGDKRRAFRLASPRRSPSGRSGGRAAATLRDARCAGYSG